MAWLIMNDEIDYASTWYPTHIVGKDKQLIPVFIGASNTMIHGLIGIYVRDRDYEQINHDKAYVFIHDPDVEADAIEDVDWEKIPDVDENRSTGREHIHLWKDVEFDKQTADGGNA